MRDNYLTVTALTKYLKRKLDIDPHLQRVLIKGEVSNFKHHSRGHMYMTIKDEYSQIRSVMFSSDNQHLKFTPENGMKVLIEGNISIFEVYGQYQLYIQSLEPDGKGALYLAYEQLKEKLSQQGYFETIYKKQIPPFPKHIAVITSPSGAAVRDIISTVKRRFPITQLTVIPVVVQGDAAVPSILDGIAIANNSKMFDTIIIGRGGGSIEDLWAFNEEKVAKAIFESTIPVISGIGHETDFTISDFTADLRAATPTGAAELSVPSLLQLKGQIEQLHTRLFRAARQLVLSYRRTLQNIQRAPVLERPTRLFRDKEQHIDQLNGELNVHLKRIRQKHLHNHQQLAIRLLHQNPKQRFHEMEEAVRDLTSQLKKNSKQILKAKEQQLQIGIHQLALLNPLAIMKRGYSITYSDEGSILSSSKRVNPGDDISIKMIDGILECTVNEVWKDDENGRK